MSAPSRRRRRRTAQYGPKAIALLEQGLSPAEVVKRITDEDPGRDTRQVAVIDTKGRSAVYTGKRVIDRNSDPKDLVHLGGYAGHVAGVNFSAQGNTLASDAVVEAMAAAYRNGKGSMAERLMDALDAGQAKGGDTRGMQSAGILVVRPLDPPNPNPPSSASSTSASTILAEPFKELRRLLNMTTGVPNRLMTQRGGAVEGRQARRGDRARRRRRSRSTRARDSRCTAWRSCYAAAGDTKLALEQLSMAIARQPKQWKFEASTDPAFEKLRSLPEFQRLIKAR